MALRCNGIIAYLGPEGSFTHEAATEFFGPDHRFAALDRRELFDAYRRNEVCCACVPAATSIVGIVNIYVDEILKLDEVTITGEHAKYIAYSLLALPGAAMEDIGTVVSHPVALEEAGLWLRRFMPDAVLKTASSTAAAAKQVREGGSLETASLSPDMAAEIYGLNVLAADIEKGPHNVTRFWVLGRSLPAPTGRDKTTLAVKVSDRDLDGVLRRFAAHNVKILNIYERPAGESLESHRYVIDVEGHSKEPFLASFLNGFSNIRVLGSYPALR